MIHRIRIQNFKSLRDVTVDLSPVTVLIGKSGTGKSNFVAAIRFLRDYLLNPQMVARQFENCRCATNRSGSVVFEIEFDVPDYTGHFCYLLVLGANSLVQSESLRYGEKTLYSQERGANQAAKWLTEPSLVSLPQPGPLMIGSLPGLEEAVIAYTALTAGIGVHVFPYDVLRPRTNDIHDSGLADDAANYLKVLRDVMSDLQTVAVRKAIVASLRCINPDVASVALDSIQSPQMAIVAHSRRDGKLLSMDLAQESDGFRRFLAYLLALYQRPAKQTLVFEEPENGIYQGVLELLTDEFKQAPEAGRGQVLLTTHSPHLLDRFSADQIRVVEIEDLETTIGPLSDDQSESLREQLLSPGELLTVVPARSK